MPENDNRPETPAGCFNCSPPFNFLGDRHQAKALLELTRQHDRLDRWHESPDAGI
jgi:hypothetical protein